MKRKYICLSLFMAVMFIGLSCTALFSYAENGSYQYSLDKSNTLRTSYNNEYYSVFTTDGDTITADGVYKGKTVVNFTVTNCDISKTEVKLSLGKDGAYHAEFTSKPSETYGSIHIAFESGDYLYYRVEYGESGWFFGGNGLDEKIEKLLESPADNVTAANAYYISASADETEINDALTQVQMTADEICKGAENDYDKARLIAKWVAENIYYDRDAKENGVDMDTIAIANVMVSRKTVCGGFANLYCAMLESQGIRAVNIKGGVTSGGVTYEGLPEGVENHEFTAFYYDDEQRWVIVDSCWDTNNVFKDGEYISGTQDEQYFDVTPEALSLNHRADKIEQRHYFNAVEYLNEYLSATETAAETTAETSADTKKNTAETTQTEKPEVQVTQAETSVDNGTIILYIIIGIMALGIITTVIFLIKANRKD